MEDAITNSLELLKVDEGDDASKLTSRNQNKITEGKASQERTARTNKVLAQKVAVVICKRGEAADLRVSARMIERECIQLQQQCVYWKQDSDEYKQRVSTWEAKNRSAKENRIAANILDREADKIEEGFNDTDFEEALAHKKDACRAKRQEAEGLRHTARRAEDDLYRLCKQAANVPPRLSEKRVWIEAAAKAKEQAAICAGVAACRLDTEADRIEELILKAKETKAKTQLHKVKRETKSTATEEIAARTEIHEVKVEAKPRATEAAQPVQVTKLPYTLKDREEDKTMTLMEYEKIREKKRKALKAKFSAAEKDGGMIGEEEGEGSKQGFAGKNGAIVADSKKNGGKPKKVNAEEVLNINKRSYYTRPPRPKYTTAPPSNTSDHRSNGGSKPPVTARGYPRGNFGDQRSSSVAPSKSVNPPAKSARDFPPLGQN